MNGTQEALSCYSTPIKRSLMHIHPEPHTHMQALAGSPFVLLRVLTTPYDSRMFLRDSLVN